MVAHVGFLLAYPGLANLVIVACADAALVVRALLEERVLSDDTAYQSYCARVAWHLVPGVF
jgi:hypothetical protein